MDRVEDSVELARGILAVPDDHPRPLCLDAGAIARDEERMRDVLTNLMHYADDVGMDFDAMVRYARHNADAERG